MERGTKKFKTPSGLEVEVQEYITGRESREIQSVFLAGMEVKVSPEGKQESSPFKPELVAKAQDKTIELLVVSVAGSKENVLKTVLDLPLKDFEMIISELDNVKDGLDKKKQNS